MEFEFTVRVSVERQEGKFASRDDIGGQLMEELSNVDPGTLEGENGGTYEVSSFEVEEVVKPKKSRRYIVTPNLV